jgi:hypothetical protein
MNHEQKSSQRDHLTLTTNKGKIELMEQQLSRAVGGFGTVFTLKNEFAPTLKIV